MNQPIRIAVVQPALTGRTVESNLERVEALARDAATESRAQLLVLPEAIGGIHVRDAVRPVDGAALHLLRQLARELGIVIAGGFLARRGRHARSVYGIIQPDGTTRLINSARPTPGSVGLLGGAGAAIADVADLGHITVGLVAGGDWISPDMVNRLHGSVQLIVGGTAMTANSVHQREAPRQLARLLAVPLVLATPAGQSPGGRGSVIIDRSGAILADQSGKGEGYCSAEVSLDHVGQDAVDATLAGTGSVPEGPWAAQPYDARTVSAPQRCIGPARCCGSTTGETGPAPTSQTS